MKYFVLSLITLMLFTAFGCRSTRKIQTAIAKKDTAQVINVRDARADSIRFIHDVLEKVKTNKIDFTSFSAKVKVDYSDRHGKGPDLTVFIRMVRDSAIWLSINATVFSYEAYRVLITPDSVKVLNKKDKEVQLRSVSYLQELIQLPFEFTTLQDLIIGNPIYLDSNIVSYKQTPNSLLLFMNGKLFKNLLTLNNNNYIVEHSKLDDINETRNRTCDLTYANYEDKGTIHFSTLRKMTVSEKAKLDIDMDFKQYSFNETLSLPFSIPKNYKRD